MMITARIRIIARSNVRVLIRVRIQVRNRVKFTVWITVRVLARHREIMMDRTIVRVRIRVIILG